jgi:ribose transport system substrate-binding protein
MIAIGVVILLGALVVGYHQTSPAEENPEIALVMKSLANEFFLTMEQEAREHQSRHGGYTLVANGIRNESDIMGQVRIVENMIAQDVDAIIIAPADSRALIPVCARAIDAGIVVVNIDNRLDQEILEARGLDIPFVGPDNRKGARKVGSYLARHLEPGDPVAIIEGIPTAHNSQERVRGFSEAFEERGLDTVDIRTAEWDMERANVVATSLLNEFPSLRGIACANDSMALGVVAAVKAAGRSDSILVVGFDNISAAQEMLAAGDILATADQYGGDLAVFGIEFALELLSGEETVEDRETPVELVTAESVRR